MNLGHCAQLALLKHSGPILVLVLLVSCGKPIDHLPVAPQHPVVKTWHGELRADHYDYLFDAEHSDTKDYIRAELSYSEKFFQEWRPLRRQIYSELNQVLPIAKQSPAIQLGDFLYWREIISGGQYPIFFRRSKSQEQERETVLDLNHLARSSAYYSLGDFAVSPDGGWIAFTEDRTGDQDYRLRIMEIATGKELNVVEEPVGASIAWFGDEALHYLRGGRQVVRLDPFSGVLMPVYEELDPSFYLQLRLSRDRRYTVVTARNPVSTEIRLINADGHQIVISQRQVGHHYRIRLADGYVYALTNRRKLDYELAVARLEQLNEWTYYETPSGTIRDFETFDRALVLLVEDQLISTLYVLRSSDDLSILLTSSQAESIRLSTNPDPGSNQVEIIRSGPHLSDQHEVIDLMTGKGKTLSDFSHRVAMRRMARQEWFKSRDGTYVPLTWLATPRTQEPAPVLITTYGAYGVPQNRDYRPEWGPLLDRGFVIVQIHVRGGGELGPSWHKAGRKKKKENSINDFIDGVDYLLRSGKIDGEMIFARGVSAGAVTVAAAVNKRPELFAGIVLRVPYLDLIESLADSTEWLTPSDKLEWGDPANPQDFAYLASYSPYEQIRSQPYPRVLLIVARRDNRVSMSQSLRWLARLRAHDTGTDEKLLYVIDEGGHFGPSDQYEIRQQDALEYAFILTR